MKYISNAFFEEIVNVLNDENEQRKYDNKNPLNIPFMISVLYQHLQNEEYKSFLEDINKYSYQMSYKDIDGYNDYGLLTIYLYTEENDNDYGFNYSYQNDLNYTYSIIFSYDTRNWGYCQCKPDYKDYREDKGCCGHGCDWSAPAFNIIKEIPLGYSSWNGDEHDYWEFEDNFYKSDKELAEEKAKKDKENRIEYIEQQMKKLEEELNKLKTF
jgi:hypothetical protein